MRTRLIGAAAIAGVFAIAACGGSNSGSPSSSGASTPTAVALHTGNPSTAVTLKEDGSSLLYPYLANELVAALTAAYPNITLQPAPGGSTKGITDTAAGAVDLGGSDAYLSPGLMSQNPNLENIPIAVSAQDVYINVPGVSSLKLDGDVLSRIYMGQITAWNDPAIAQLNSGVTLPSTPIVPVRRVDGSGDTFLFTSFLSATSQAWSNGPSLGTTVTWPAVSAEVTASGNPGMVTACQSHPGCVAYIGISAQSSADAAGLTKVMLQNQAGNFLFANPATMAAAVNAVGGNLPDNLAQSLIYQSGAQAYPIVNFEYLVVSTTQSSSDKALALRTFLAWAIDPNGGATQAHLSAKNFTALPSSILNKVQAAIAKIAG